MSTLPRLWGHCSFDAGRASGDEKLREISRDITWEVEGHPKAERSARRMSGFLNPFTMDTHRFVVFTVIGLDLNICLIPLIFPFNQQKVFFPQQLKALGSQPR